MYYQISTMQNKRRYYLKFSSFFEGVRLAAWTPSRVKGRMFVKREEAENCVTRDLIKNWTIEGPGGGV